MSEAEHCYHDFETGTWGVILGVSKCKRCGITARTEHFRVGRWAAALLVFAILAVAGCAHSPQLRQHEAALQSIARHNTGRPLIWLRMTGDYRHAMFCALAEHSGWFADPPPQGIDPGQLQAFNELRARNGMSPARVDPRYAHIPQAPAVWEYSELNPMANPDYVRGAPHTVACYCWSEARREVLAVCPDEPARLPPWEPGRR